MPELQRPIFSFPPFGLDPSQRLVTRNGEAISLTPKEFDTLWVLVEAAGRVVDKEELINRVWPDSYVGDGSLARNISVLRRTLGDGVIETHRSRGYRISLPIIARTSSPAVLPAEAQREQEATAASPIAITENARPAVSPYQPTKMLFGIGAAVLMLALAISVWLMRKRAGSVPTTPPSIAVLPFVDMSQEKNQEYFSDGLAEDLLNNLAKIQGLRVAARTSSFQFNGKNEDLRTVGEKLNVGAILEGSVQKQGNKVRVTAQLIKAADGFHLWSETYDRDLNDIFAVQDDIARSVAISLKVTLLGASAATSTPSKNPDAYNAYLQGRYFSGRGGRENLDQAVGYYEQAVKLDPGYAPAWAELAGTLSTQAGSHYRPVDEGFRKAREAVERALSLDPNLAVGYEQRGVIQRFYDWDWTGADASYQRALALEPGNAEILGENSRLAANLGRLDEALSADRRVVALDPLFPDGWFALGTHAYWAGRLEEASAAVKKSLELDPSYGWAHNRLGQIELVRGHPQEALTEMKLETNASWALPGQALAYCALGQEQAADEALAEYIAKFHSEVHAYAIAEVYAFRGEADKAFEWLDRAYEQRDSPLVNVKEDPLLKNLKSDPRYTAFLKKIRLPE